MVKLRNKGADDIALFVPEGELGSLYVAAGQVVDIPGELVTGDAAGDGPDDAFVIRGAEGDLRSWPHSRWGLIDDTPPAPEPAPQPIAAPDVAHVPATPSEV